MKTHFALPMFVTILLLGAVSCNTLTSLAPTEPVEEAANAAPEEAAPPALQPTQNAVDPDNPYPGAEDIGDPYFPGIGNGGYDVKHYDLALDIDVESNSIIATATIDLVATQELSSLNLDFIGLSVDRVSVDGQDADYERKQPELTIYLADYAQVGDVLQIVVDYHGSPGEDVDSGLVPQYSEGWTHYGDGIMVAGEPTGSATWYPVNEHPADKATYSYKITVADPYVVAANGVLMDVQTNGDKSTYYWEMDDAIAPYLTTIGVGEFDVEEISGPNGLPIRNYFGKGISSSVRSDFAREDDIIAFYNRVFGPYPFDAAGVVVHDIDLSFSLETATMIVFGNSFTDEYVVAHEMAHMWFGDSIGLKEWQDIWLNEGFATYASQLWTEEAYGLTAMNEDISNNYWYLATMPENRLVETGDPGPDYLFDGPSVYVKGALVLHALRLEIGEDAFFSALLKYVEQYRDSNATVEDFIVIAEEQSGQQLGDFFDLWLYQPGLPDIPQMGLYAKDFR